jgi:hypothetical protein
MRGLSRVHEDLFKSARDRHRALGEYFEECGRMGIRVGGLISILRVAALDSPRSPPKTVFCLISLPLYTADFKNRKRVFLQLRIGKGCSFN